MAYPETDPAAKFEPKFVTYTKRDAAVCAKLALPDRRRTAAAKAPDAKGFIITLTKGCPLPRAKGASWKGLIGEACHSSPIFVGFVNWPERTKADIWVRSFGNKRLSTGSTSPSDSLKEHPYLAQETNDRLESWKEISSFIGRDERTARRWEKVLGMPVHREPGAAQGRVYALRAELEAWLRRHDQEVSNHRSRANGDTAPGAGPSSEGDDGEILRAAEPAAGTPAQSQRRRWLWLAAAACAALLLWLADGTLVRSFNPVAPRVLRFQQLTDDGRRKFNLRTDGATLFFDEFDGQREVLASVPVTGGAVQHIPAPFSNSWLQDVSADGRRLLVESHETTEIEGSLWVLSATGGSAQRLGDVVCQVAAWSPDGTKVAYANRTGVYLAVADGSNSRLPFQLQGNPENLRWSPDGHRIRFLVRDQRSYVQSPWELEVGAAGKQAPPESLNGYFGENCCADWSWTNPGHYFLFIPAASEPRHLRVASGEGWNPRTAAANAQEIPVGLGRVMELAPGKDTHSVYLIGSSLRRGEFLRVDAGSARVDRHLSGISAEYLTYSRDGRWISYTRLPDHSLWRSRADGSEAVQLTSAPVAVQLSAWSPDGRKIAYMAQAPGKPWRIFVVPRDGGNPQEASGGGDQQGAPTWSPDGQLIAYGNVLCHLAGTCAIHVIHLADRSVESLPGSEGMRTARWSPNGKYIAALHTGSHEVWLFDMQHRRWATIADSVSGDDMAWSRDSRYVYVNDPRGMAAVILRVRVSDRKRETVVDFSSLQRLYGNFTRWFGLAPDDSPILLRIVDAAEIYALDWTDH